MRFGIHQEPALGQHPAGNGRHLAAVATRMAGRRRSLARGPKASLAGRGAPAEKDRRVAKVSAHTPRLNRALPRAALEGLAAGIGKGGAGSGGGKIGKPAHAGKGEP